MSEAAALAISSLPPAESGSGQRTPSIRSVASNSSLASGTSLTRRPRIRSRTRTLTQEFEQTESVGPGTIVDDTTNVASVPPVRPTRSPRRPNTSGGEPAGANKESKAAKQAASLAGINTTNIQPTAFSRVPNSSSARDSFMTDQSGTSASLYPPSTASGTESPPSPRSIVVVDHEDNVVVNDSHDYDTDDVSYRLRLLASNSYFLPPAHVKPKPAELSPITPSRKTPSPGFLDFFRGRSKSKPTTPSATGNQGFDSLMPSLRTPSDATTTTSAYVLRQDRPAAALHSPAPPQGRVVVVREKVPDLAMAAKQAEIEIKVRNARREQQNPQLVDLVIDPTDAVDLPPPSAGSLFAVQASALSGLGVQDSLGAAVLADCLPPPRTPGGYDPEDEWRRALLKAAVGHSFDNIHAASMPPSPTPPSPNPGRMIDQRILSHPIAETQNQPFRTESPKSIKSSKSQSTQHPTSRASTTIPRRAETPAPLMPLNPPPRKFINPLYSLSQTDLPATVGDSVPPVPALPTSPSIVKTVSSESLRSRQRKAGTISPPPVSDATRSVRISQETRSSSIRTASFESSVDSAPSTHARPSMSEYSQASPTVSAFHDAESGGRSSVSQSRRIRPSFESRTSTSRQKAISPPPRVSSTIPPLALSPPPRSSSLNNRLVEVHEPPAQLVEILAPEPTTPPLPDDSVPDVPVFSLLSISIPSGAISPPSIRSAPPPSGPSTPSFFDAVQMQPNALDDLDASSDESESEDDPESQSTESLSARQRLMRLGNHSTPHLRRSPVLEDPPPMPSVDPKQAIGHVSKPAPFFSQKMSGKSEDGHGPPSSTFDIYKYTRWQQSGSIDIGRKRATTPPPVPVSLREDDKNKQGRDSLKKLDSLLLQHIQAEKNRFRQIANNVASTSNFQGR